VNKPTTEAHVKSRVETVFMLNLVSPCDLITLGKIGNDVLELLAKGQVRPRTFAKTSLVPELL
jgi:hypothetical protein